MKKNLLFEKLEKHIGHAIEIACYEDNKQKKIANVAVECIDCNEVLIDEDNPNY